MRAKVLYPTRIMAMDRAATFSCHQPRLRLYHRAATMRPTTRVKYRTTPELKGRPMPLTSASSNRAASFTKPWIRPYCTNNSRPNDSAIAPMKVGHLNALRLK